MLDVAAQRQARRTRRRLIIATAVTILAAANAVAFDPEERRLILQLAFAALGVLAVTAAVGGLRRAAPVGPRSALDRPPARRGDRSATAPADLVRVARRLEAAQASAADARRHLGPVVAAIAADRIRDRAHTAVEPGTVYARLPQPVAPELTLLLDPALEALDTRALPGLDAAGAERLVDALEAL